MPSQFVPSMVANVSQSTPDAVNDGAEPPAQLTSESHVTTYALPLVSRRLMLPTLATAGKVRVHASLTVAVYVCPMTEPMV